MALLLAAKIALQNLFYINRNARQNVQKILINQEMNANYAILHAKLAHPKANVCLA